MSAALSGQKEDKVDLYSLSGVQLSTDDARQGLFVRVGRADDGRVLSRRVMMGR
ncbi:MAG: hypothetical protein IJ243_02950 [Prevotella sp.]|nr:hypothetical protein [Prevotella sp.]